MGIFSKKTEITGSQKLLVNVQPGETRIALTDADLLVDLHIEQTSRERTVGNIYKGVVVKVNPAFQAAFIEYGEERNGFLSISDVDPSLYKGGDQRGRPKIQSVLKNGQQLTVQVLKERVREKGAALTTSISLPGRFMVLTAHSDRSGVSRKIGDADKRNKLKDVLTSLIGDDKKGVIIRTAGIDRKPAELKRDFASLQKEWKAIEARFEKQKKPGLLHQEPKSIIRVLRDYFSEEVSEVWVDTPEGYQEALKYFKAVLPKFQKRLKLHVDDDSLFSAHGLEEQISALESSKVPLKSGGGLVVESTEALVAIDVNSGRSNQASDIEATALRTNLEAADEVARQLRLRNLGGLIVVDFIDMVPQKNRERVEQALAVAMKNDKARISIGKISEFGLLELSRQRIDVELSRGLRAQCPTCAGSGHVPTVNSSANNVLREIRAMAVTEKYQEIHGNLPLDHANFLLNHRRESLRDLELEFEITIHLNGDPTLPPGQSVRLTGSSVSEEGEVMETASAQSNQAKVGESAGDGRSKRRRRGRGRGRGRGGNGEYTEGPSARPVEADGNKFESAREPDDADGNKFETAQESDDADGNKFGPAQGSHEAESEGIYSAVENAGNEDEAKSHEPPATAAAPVQHRANGGGAPGNSGSPALAAQKPLLAERRGGWLSRMNSSHVAVGDTLYASAHQPTIESAFPVILPTFKSSNPFLGMEVEDGTTLFTSTHRGDAEGGETAGQMKSAKPGRSRGAPAKGRAGRGKGVGSGAKGEATGVKGASARGKSGASRAKGAKAG